MTPEQILSRRMEAHRAACEGVETDILIRACFGPYPPIAPLPSPVREGAMLQRQAT